MNNPSTRGKMAVECVRDDKYKPVKTALYKTKPVKQEAQLMLTNPSDVFIGQSKSTSMILFDMLGMVFY